MLPWQHDGEHLSYRVAWEKLRPVVLNATYYPERFANESRFRHWVSDLFDFYTYEKLARSRAHPAPPAAVRKLWQAIANRIEDPTKHGPIRIVFMGGSVTSGRECDYNPLDLPGTNVWGGTQLWCAYPNRLHVLLNGVLFPDRSPQDKVQYPIFEVTNMAMQATNSQVGAMALEYNLLPALEESPPHIIVSSYSANDALDEEAPTFWRHQQSFVRAAQRVRPCDDDLPLVVLNDDWFSEGSMQAAALVNTGSLYKTASWHNLMAIMYSNTVRSASVYHSNFTDEDRHPLFGSKRINGQHLGMGYHIAQGWALFFNMVGALHDACTEPLPMEPKQQQDAPQPRNASSPLSAALAKAERLPVKYIGRYAGPGTTVLREWDENVKFKERLCDGSAPATRTAGAVKPPFSTANCAYAWIVNPMSVTSVGEGVQKAVDYVLLENVGWEVADRKPKSGWRTNLTVANLTEAGGQQSHFTIEVRNITQPVDTFTLLSLKSYGPEWAGSQLLFDVRVIPGGGGGGGEQPPTSSAATRHVDGYHDKAISVPYPHRFRLSGSGAQVGDTIRATFTLTRGKNFFISGIAFCRSLIGDMPVSD
jgi:hypothetical protein